MKQERNASAEPQEGDRGEGALRQDHAFFKNLVETAQIIIVVLDTKGRIVRINPYLEELSGFSSEKVQGRDWFSTFLPERDQDRIQDLFATAVGGIQTRGNVNAIVTKDGRERQIEWFDSILTDAKGHAAGLLAVGQDITDRLQAERALEQRAEEMSALHAVGRQVSASLEPDSVVEAALYGLATTLAPDLSLLYVRRDADLLLQGVHAEHPRHRTLASQTDSLRRDLCEGDTRDRRPVYSTDPHAASLDIAEAYRQAGLHSFAVLPVLRGREVLGVLCLASEGEQDLSQRAAFLEALAGNVAIGLQNALLHQEVQLHAESLEQEVAERTRAQAALALKAHELTRANKMVSALNEVSGRLRATLNPDEMLATLGAELELLGLTCVVALLEPDVDTLLIHYHSIPPEQLAPSDELVDGALNDLRIPCEVWPVQEVLEQGQALYDRRPLQAMSVLIPGVSEKLLKRAMHGVGLSKDSPMAYLPLAAEDQLLGVLAVWGEALREADVPALAVFANQLGSAFHWARQVSQVTELEILREVARLRTELMTDISHELRTPLGLIRVSAATLLREDAELGADVQQEFLQTIVDEADRMELIVGDLLDLSRMEGGRFRLDREPWDLQLLVEGVRASMEVQFPEHRFVQDLPSGPLVAAIDAGRIEQVLRNLLDNAAKYSPQGGVITVRGSRQEGQVLIQVNDQGIGIPEESLHNVFERFYRVDNQPTMKAKGVGLGLSICQGIVRVHGGQIWAESSHGTGTTVSFTLPIDPALMPGSY